MGEYEKALEHYTRALLDGPSDPDVLYNLELTQRILEQAEQENQEDPDGENQEQNEEQQQEGSEQQEQQGEQPPEEEESDSDQQMGGSPGLASSIG